MSLGENINRLRTGKNMSQGDLAEALEVSRQSISKWETDGATPELDKLVRLSELFGVTLDELVTGKAGQKEESHRMVVVERRGMAGRKMAALVFFVWLFWRCWCVRRGGLSGWEFCWERRFLSAA